MMLSIIIPTFNSERVIKRALTSILNQSFHDFEILIMDNLSIDNTIKIISSFDSIHIKVFSEPDSGIYDAMNKGIAKASGEWLYFMGSDDYFINDEVLHSFFSLPIHEYDVVYGDVDNVMGLYSGEWNVQTIGYNRCHQAIFYRKNVFKKLGLYNTKYRILADHEFNIRWFFDNKIKSKYFPITIAHFSPGGISGSPLTDMWPDDEYRIIVERGFRKLPDNERIWMLEQIITKENNLLSGVQMIKFYVLYIYSILCRKIHNNLMKRNTCLSTDTH